MFIVNKDIVQATKQKLDDPVKSKDAIADIKRMIKIKQALLWRADAGTCCGSLDNIASSLAREVAILEKTLNALQRDDKSEAIRSLEEYQQILEAQPECGQTNICH